MINNGISPNKHANRSHKQTLTSSFLQRISISMMNTSTQTKLFRVNFDLNIGLQTYSSRKEFIFAVLKESNN